MLRSRLLPTSVAAAFAALLVQCGGKPTITGVSSGGSGGHGGASFDGGSGFGGIIGIAQRDGSVCNVDGASCGPGGDAGSHYEPACGDGRLNPGETCDDGNTVSGDGCTANCLQVEANFECPTPGVACVSTVKCGDKKITGPEECDDGNAVPNDGCSATCQLEKGWACPIVGISCEAAKCGDSIVAGSEQCDDGNDTPKDGCDANCQLEDGFQCLTPGQKCTPTVCGDGKVEGTERCDDGNHDLGDGCTPFCQLEPNCDAGACTSPCGDGIKFANEACDDGNTRDGDGCSSTCTIEPGYQCSLLTAAEPDSIGIPIVLRDFAFSHVDFQLDDSVVPHEPSGDDHVIVQPTLGTAADVSHQDGGVTVNLDHKPVYQKQSCHPAAIPSAANNWTKCTLTTFDADSFEQWYRDVPGVNTTVLQTLTLGRIGTNAYRFDSAANGSDGFFPLDALGATGDSCNGDPHDFSFTSEVRYWFEYDAANPPTLTFSGDDDVFVFVNHQLALDLGGIHGVEDGCFTLDAETGISTACAAALTALNASLTAAGQPTRDYSHEQIHAVTGLATGNIYEIAVFQAERNTCGSNYKLTLSNFLASKSVCKSVCGDGIVTPDEICDDGKANNTGAYGKCAADCKSRGPYCGDGIVQKVDGEQCDDGVNLSQYGGCAPGCVNGPYCGDGIVQSSEGEQCDDGKNLGAYNGCAKNCVLGPRCGDGIVQTADGEQCDDHNRVSGDGCNANCQLAAVH